MSVTMATVCHKQYENSSVFACALARLLLDDADSAADDDADDDDVDDDVVGISGADRMCIII